jgi:hypothetical protein
MKERKNNLDEAVDALKNEPIPAGPPQEAIDAVLQKLATARAADKRVTITERIRAMKTLPKLAAAAVIIIAVLLGIYYFGSSVEVASVAWGQVAEKVEQANTFVYRVKITMTGMPGMPKAEPNEVEIVAYNSSEHGMRTDAYVGGKIAAQTYIIPDEEALITVTHEQKQYMRMRLTDELLAKMKEESHDPKEMVKEFTKSEYTELGRKTIDGIEAEGIESRHPRIMGGLFDDVLSQLWVDVETDLPVLMQVECSSSDGTIQMKLVMDDFEWDVIDLDSSAFEANIPDDYKLMADVEIPAWDGTGAITGLSRFAELTGGEYPSSLEMMTAITEAAEALRDAMLADPNRDPNKPLDQQAMMQEVMKVQAVCIFYGQLLSEEKDPAYYGDKVTAEFPDAVLMRWKVEDGLYRIIFGDLTTGDVTPERLAELEAMPLNTNPFAIKPTPADGTAVNPSVELRLSWMPGLYVTDHQVYLGTDSNKLPLLAQVTGPNCTVPSALVPDTTYCWRVDEIQSDGSVTAGDTWNFTTGKPIGWWARWTFDETGGSTAFDSSGNGHDAALNNMDDDDWVDGALEFDGVDDYVSIPALNLHSNTVTVSAWIRRDGEQAESDTGIVFSRDGGTTAGLCLGHGEGWTVNYHLGYNWNNERTAWNWDSKLFVPDNEWVFVALVVEPAKATLYLGQDGMLSSATNAIRHDIEEFDGLTCVGQDKYGRNRHFRGLIDEVRIYNSALSQAEVEALYEEGVAVTE